MLLFLRNVVAIEYNADHYIGLIGIVHEKKTFKHDRIGWATFFETDKSH